MMNKQLLAILILVAATMAGCHAKLVVITRSSQFHHEFNQARQGSVVVYITAAIGDRNGEEISKLIQDYSMSTNVLWVDNAIGQLIARDYGLSMGAGPALYFFRNGKTMEGVVWSENVRDRLKIEIRKNHEEMSRTNQPHATARNEADQPQAEAINKQPKKKQKWFACLRNRDC